MVGSFSRDLVRAERDKPVRQREANGKFAQAARLRDDVRRECRSRNTREIPQRNRPRPAATSDFAFGQLEWGNPKKLEDRTRPTHVATSILPLEP